MTWDFITDFGDTAVTVPLIALVLVFLAITRRWRPAIGWALAILGCGGSIGAIKALLIGCGYRTSVAGVVSPSGHAAMSTAGFRSLGGVNAGRVPPPNSGAPLFSNAPA